ncbi:ABC transporter substrate-binding protein [Amycolatopsis deserti]|uniref:ABC transporter substrate-binding protein n=1 Tax=Amycolatopsis deserti TaxID=185696 RepID=A0ABQ3ICL3_9PSEU|nr:ABC transporter substrate-binding protein [Amycolatopsis deserti]GHE79292.1 ABC transporter substrate-binding protein [Amycolatopsis deserti]
MKPRPGRLRIGALAAAVLLAVSACSGAASGGGTPGQLTVAGFYPIVTLDPHGPQADAGTASAGTQIYSRLVRLQDGQYVPDLATGWTASPDAKTWTFTLRDGLTFSDGSPLGPGDVVASVQRIANLKGPQAASWSGITATAAGTNQVVLTATKPDASVLGKLTLLWITPAVRSEEPGFFNRPVGSGPFRVDGFTPGQSLVLVPNEHFWGERPKLDKVVMRTIPEVSARVAALRTGEIQATWGIPDDQIAQVEGEPGITVESVPSLAVYTMWMNSGRPALADERVRRALWQAVDFGSIIASLYPETGSPADSPVPPGVPGYAKQPPVVHDPAAAKEALTQAGFDFGRTLELQFSGAEFRQFTQAVASDLAKIGVKVEPREKEKAVFLEDLLGMRWDINLQSLAIDTGDLASNLGRLYPCAAGRTGYCDPELDRVLAEAGAISDPARRAELYGQAQRIIWRAAVGMYPMFVNIPYAWRDTVHGFRTSPAYQPDFTKVTVS